MSPDLQAPIAQLAVVSDIHAFTTKERSSSSVVDLSPGAQGRNPLRDLVRAVRTLGIEADALLCAGDICNQADYGGLEGAWQLLHELRQELKAAHLLATTGNHDLDSRWLSGHPDPDPKGGLLALLPAFPFEDEAQTNKYWARNYAIQRLESGIVVVVLNTSAFHGGQQAEINYGRVSSRTISALESEISGTKDAPGHVLLCHHHPMPLTGWREGEVDGEYIKNGQLLLDALVRATERSWLVIHGHRHLPRLIHGASNTTAVPFVLGAGSLGARMAGVPNQFHLVRLYASSESNHSSLVGVVDTLGWTDATGWGPISAGSLPPVCGFGYRGQIDSLAREVEALIGDAYQSWSHIRGHVPSVDLLMPEALKEFEAALQRRGINILRNQQGRMVQVGK